MCALVVVEREVVLQVLFQLRYFGLSERFWVNHQARYSLEVGKNRLKNWLDNEVRVCAMLHLACIEAYRNAEDHQVLVSLCHLW